MLNKVMLIGRLGREPELRYMPNGTPVAKLNVATDESYTDRDGNKVEKTEWHNVQVFDRQAENCSNYLGKGSLVYVEGSLQTRKWQDQQGQDRYITEVRAQRVKFLERKGERSMEQGAAPASTPFRQQGAGQNYQPKRSPHGIYGEAEPTRPSESGMQRGGAADMDEVPF